MPSPVKKPEDFVAIGKILRPQGIEGKIRIESYTAPAGNISKYKFWHLSSGKVLTNNSCKQHGKVFIATIEDLHTPEEASTYTHELIYIPKTDLPKTLADEYYWHELEGMQVIQKDYSVLGNVAYLCEGPQCDLLMVHHSSGKEMIVPYEKNTIISIDRNKRTITVDWIDPDDL